MRIAFDAKRALNNGTGLGNHARILLNALMRDFPDNEYLLFSPKVRDEFLNQLEGDFDLFLPETRHQRVVHPVQAWAFLNAIVQLFIFTRKNALWRSWGITGDLTRENVQLYHGLSNELPFNIRSKNIRTVVTIHDVIFLKHTAQYPWIDRQFYKAKTKYAIRYADKIIAVSNETKQDLLEMYDVPERRIEVIYPAVDPIYYQTADHRPQTAEEKGAKYILNVSSFFPRKNQKKLVEAYALIASEVEEELWLVGNEGTTKKEIEQLILERKLTERIKIKSGINNEELPGIYRNASAFVFPSLFEGFGAPVLEALFSKTPVVATKGGAIEEAAGKDSLFVDPNSAEDIANKISKVLKDEQLKKAMIEKGFAHAQSMTDTVFAERTMNVYRELL